MILLSVASSLGAERLQIMVVPVQSMGNAGQLWSDFSFSIQLTSSHPQYSCTTIAFDGLELKIPSAEDSGIVGGEKASPAAATTSIFADWCSVYRSQ